MDDEVLGNLLGVLLGRLMSWVFAFIVGMCTTVLIGIAVRGIVKLFLVGWNWWN